MTALDVIGPSHLSWWDIAFAGIVVVVSVVIARLTRRGVQRAVARLAGSSADGARRVAKVAAYAVVLIGLGVALSLLGADVQPLQTAAIILAVVVYLALRGVAGQFVAGIVLRSKQPFRVGDHVESGDHLGVVKEISAVSTVIETYDGRHVHIPNLDLVSRPIINRTTGGAIRVDVEVRAMWGGDPAELLSAIHTAATKAPHVLPTPDVVVGVRAAGSGRLTALVRCWHVPDLDSDLVAGAIALALSRTLSELGVPNSSIHPPPPPPFSPMPSV